MFIVFLLVAAIGVVVLLWGLLHPTGGVSIEQAEQAAERLRDVTLNDRVVRSPQDFASAFYSDSSVPIEAIERVLKEFVWQFGPETRKMEPNDSIADFYPGLDMADLAFRITKVCGRKWEGLKAINHRIETVDDFIQLATRLLFPDRCTGDT